MLLQLELQMKDMEEQEDTEGMEGIIIRLIVLVKKWLTPRIRHCNAFCNALQRKMKSEESTIYLHYGGTCVIVFRYLGRYCLFAFTCAVALIGLHV